MTENNEKKENVKSHLTSLRSELKKVIKDPNSSPDDKRNAVSKLDRLPKSSSKVRIRNRCFKNSRL